MFIYFVTQLIFFTQIVTFHDESNADDDVVFDSFNCKHPNLKM